MRLTPICTPSLIVYCLHLPTDSSKMHTQVSCFHPLRLAFFGVVFFLFVCFSVVVFFLLLIDHFFSKRPQEKPYLILCEISVCASKRLFLLVTYKKKKKKKKKRVVSKSHRIYPVNPVKSNGTAQMHPGRRYTVLDCSSISYIFHCSCMKNLESECS